jgi:hypothetical protein
MHFLTRISSESDVNVAISELCSSLGTDIPSCIVIYYTEDYDTGVLVQHLSRKFPGVSIVGCTSCKGIMTDQAYICGAAIGLMAIYDSGLSSYGSGLADLNQFNDINSATRHAIYKALANADRVGEVPNLIVLHATPGSEEDIIAAVDDIFGTLVPIIGGSAADHSIQQHWSILTEEGWCQNGIAVQLYFPSRSLATGFSAGYSPTEFVGTITKAEERVLYEIDGEPAKEIYKEWVSDHSNIQISDEYIFEHVTSFPLGRIAGDLYDQPYYKLTHPIRITESGGLELFANVHVNEEITLMTGSREQLINRASRVIKEANSKNYTESEKLGVISIFCAGAMLRLKGEMDRVYQHMKEQLDDTPFICPFTYGEQGRFAGGENAHGNLMISSVIFYESE